MEIITSAQNPKIKEIIKLQKPRERKAGGLIVVEGHQEILMALGAGFEIEKLFFCPDLAGKKRIEKIEEDRVISVVPAVLKKIAFRENPDGFLALVKYKIFNLDKIKLSKNPLVIVLESVEKPGNLGAILRSADAAGVDAVIISDQRTDIYNPNVIRASLGTVFTNQIAVSSVKEIQKWLSLNKIKSLAATPEANRLYAEINYQGGIAIVMGEEHKGLSQEWLEKADEKVRIPMAGKIDSLNVSVSTAIILFEAIRQR
ncbi:MAG: RNA methyltransferase [Patescibacteria group bacterium]